MATRVRPLFTREQRGHHRQDFIEAGWQCWATRGYDEITVEDVCHAAGMAKGSFYGYFHSKADLLVALMQEDFADLEVGIQDIELCFANAVDRLVAFASLMHRHTNDPARSRVRLDCQQQVSIDPYFRSLFVDLTLDRRTRLSGWVTAGARSGEFPSDIDAEGIATAFLALCIGLSVQTQGRDAGFAWERIEAAVGRMVLGFTIPPKR
jgi:AcrR family transcriptional regulator